MLEQKRSEKNEEKYENFSISKRRRITNETEDKKGNYNVFLHKRNIHKNHFLNIEELGKSFSYLNLFLLHKENGTLSYNFEDSHAVYFLSKAILKKYYSVDFYLPYVYEIPLHILGSALNFNEKGVLCFKGNEQTKRELTKEYEKHNDFLNKVKKEEISDEFDETFAKLDEDTMYPKSIEIRNDYSNNKNGKKTFLCPCIPGRADYIHAIGDLTEEDLVTTSLMIKTNQMKRKSCNDTNGNDIIKSKLIKVLDIGVGASCIYPLLGKSICNWSFVGTDINTESLSIAQINILLNKAESNITLKLQKDQTKILLNMIEETDFFFFSMCNPPFYSDPKECNKHPNRKLKAHINEVVHSKKKLCESSYKKIEQNNFINTIQNANANMKENNPFDFSESLEFYDKKESEMENKYIGGEYSFIIQMLKESNLYFHNVVWFTSLISKMKHVKMIKKVIIESMRMYHIQGKEQISFIDHIIKNELIWNDSVSYTKNTIIPKTFPIHISQYRILKSNQGRVRRTIICWSYFNQEQIQYLKREYNKYSMKREVTKELESS